MTFYHIFDNNVRKRFPDKRFINSFIMSDDYAALLKNARDIPILNTGIDNSVTSECTFPTKEHPSLITHTGKTVNTPLNSTLSARHLKLPST